MIDRQRIDSFPERITLGCTPFVGTLSWVSAKKPHTAIRIATFGELINEDEIIPGGEESAGTSLKGHYPKKDGIVAYLLAAKAVAARGASLSEQLAALYERVGRLEQGRIGI